MIEINYSLFRLFLGFLIASSLFAIYLCWFDIKDKNKKLHIKKTTTNQEREILLDLLKYISLKDNNHLLVYSLTDKQIVFISSEVKNIVDASDFFIKIQNYIEVYDNNKIFKEKDSQYYYNSFSIKTKDNNNFAVKAFPLRELLICCIEKNKEKNKVEKNIVFETLDHEIVMPLANLSLLVELIQEDIDQLQNKRLKKQIDEIYDNVLIINTLLKNILPIIRGAYLSTEKPFMKIEINSCLNSILKYLGRNYEIEYHNFSYRKDIYFLGNSELLTIAITNLVKNAYIHSKNKEKKIAIILTSTQDKILIHIGDRGKGVKNDELVSIFRLSYRGKSLKEESYSGHGLGLFIVSNIVKLHNGSVKAYSKEGFGTIFTIELSITKEAL